MVDGKTRHQTYASAYSAIANDVTTPITIDHRPSTIDYLHTGALRALNTRLNASE